MSPDGSTLPEVADVLLAVRDELRADVLDVIAGHIREQEALSLKRAPSALMGVACAKLEALTALDQDLRRRWGENPNPEKP